MQNNSNISTATPISTPCGNPPHELFYLRPITCTEMQRILSMPSNKSPGLDKVNVRVINDYLPVIPRLLTNINCSISTTTYPSKSKKAEVIPLLKDEDHEQAPNNRPLSLLSVASKICEKVVLILNIFVSDTILEAMDRKMLTAFVLLDSSKAFNSRNHSILLYKLECIGASQSSLRGFDRYLTGRSQVVRIG